MKIPRFFPRFLMVFPTFLSVFLSLSQAAAGEVSDSHETLASLTSWLPAVPFEKAFTCGESVELMAPYTNCELKCGRRLCTTQCYGGDVGVPVTRKVKLFTENCTAESVSIYGDNGWALEVSKEDYIRGGYSLLIPILKNIGHYNQPDGDIKIVSAFPSFMGLYITQPPNPFMAVTVRAEIQLGTSSQKPEVNVVLSRNQSGLMQVLVLSNGPGDELLMAKGIKNAF